MSMAWRCAAGRQHGFTLMETLVALLLLSMGTVTAAGALAYTIAASRSSGHRTVAVMLATEAAEVMRANRSAAAGGSYDVPTPQEKEAGSLVALRVCPFPSCTPQTLAMQDVDTLRLRAREALPQGSIEMARVQGDGVPGVEQIDVWLLWVDPPLMLGRAAVPKEDISDCPPLLAHRDPQPSCLHVRVVL